MAKDKKDKGQEDLNPLRHYDPETYTTDNDGNIISCPHCGTRHMRRDGWNYQKKEQKQMWLCYGCHRKTLKPKIIQPAPFTKETPEPEDLPVPEIIEHRKKMYAQKVKGRNSKKLINLNINIDGPIGIAHFGDPHVDDDGTNIGDILQKCDIINDCEGLFAGNLGDIQNNWVGRLGFLYGQQSMSAKESWRLTEYFVNKMDWLYLIAGNHDVWSGDGDPLDFLMRDTKGVYEKWGARMCLNFPNGKKIRINARHTFKGNSIWNTAHGVSRAIQTGWRDHILTCGHTHVSGYQVLKDPSTGLISHGLQVASFKILDNYADKLGLDCKNIFNCPVTIIDPRYEDDDNRLITTIFSLEKGAEYLNYLRSSM
mgnify:CR=1 FL=1